MLRNAHTIFTISLPPEDQALVEELARVRLAMEQLHERVRAIAPRLTAQASKSAAGPCEMLSCLTNEHRLRQRYFSNKLFQEPAWSVLLAVAESEHAERPISVSDAYCATDGSPPTTIRSNIVALEALGLIGRSPDRSDRRRYWLVLTPRGRELMSAFLADVARGRATS